MTENSFARMGLVRPLLRAIKQTGYDTPTPIQADAIPHILNGKDVLGLAQTGSGKTAAFALPTLQRLEANGGAISPGSPRALVLAPTRELAEQINNSFKKYGGHMSARTLVVYGGAPIAPQIRKMYRGVDVLVATPGRLLDLMNQGKARLDDVNMFIMDEADRMLDMGFIHDIRKIISYIPKNRQTLFFSATMAGEAGRLAGEILSNPVKVQVDSVSCTVDTVRQQVMFVDTRDKEPLLRSLLQNSEFEKTLVFTRTKHRADKLARNLVKAGVRSEAIHGGRTQSYRSRALAEFTAGRVKVLVATDVASRGIDVKDVSHVINYEMPGDPESYIHRIGRTARCGAHGTAISMCCVEERGMLREIERATGKQLEVEESHPYHAVFKRLDQPRKRVAPPEFSPHSRQNRKKKYVSARRRAAAS